MGTAQSANHTRRRGRALAAAGVLVLAALAAACGPPGPPPPGCPTAPPDSITSTLINRANGDRAARGLGGFWWDARLACLADEWSDVMAGRNGLAHRDLGATIRSPGFESYGGLAENVFVGPGSSDGNVIHDAWMGSAGHRNNILGNYQWFGAGWAKGPDGRIWVTENFGRPL